MCGYCGGFTSRGTYVAEPSIRKRERLISFTDDMRSRGFDAGRSGLAGGVLADERDDGIASRLGQAASRTAASGQLGRCASSSRPRVDLSTAPTALANVRC
ncbi:hypothetical protein GCM10009872_15400 [Actinopolymorpha rutila]